MVNFFYSVLKFLRNGIPDVLIQSNRCKNRLFYRTCLTTSCRLFSEKIKILFIIYFLKHGSR